MYIYKYCYVFVDIYAFKSTRWGNVQIYKGLGNLVIFYKSHKNLAFYCKRTSPGWFLKNKNLKSCKHYQYRIVSFPFSIRHYTSTCTVFFPHLTCPPTLNSPPLPQLFRTLCYLFNMPDKLGIAPTILCAWNSTLQSY